MDSHKIPPELLGPGPIRQVRLDLTTRCNLRCVYCAVSQKGYAGTDMAPATIETLTRMVVALHRFNPLEPIDMNGHGETTILPGWVDICRDLLARGIDIRLTSNFAKEFDRTELETLAMMHGIAISIDAADRHFLRRMRRKADVRQIIANIHMVRMTALRLFRRPPYFQFLCGLYDQNALYLDELARLAISLGIHDVAFWNLNPYPPETLDSPPEDRVRPLDDLDDAELRLRMRVILEAFAILRRAGVLVHVQGDFVRTLSARVGLLYGQHSGRHGAAKPHAATSNWYDPGLP